MRARQKLSRRSFMRVVLAAAGAAPVLLAGIGTAHAKVTKQSVSYRETPNGANRCSTCANFIEPSSCKLVEGSINPDGWCGLFKPKK